MLSLGFLTWTSWEGGLGRSMGGGGTWTVATRQPDLFAAIAPIYGYPIYDSVDLLTGSGTTT